MQLYDKCNIVAIIASEWGAVLDFMRVQCATLSRLCSKVTLKTERQYSLVSTKLLTMAPSARAPLAVSLLVCPPLFGLTPQGSKPSINGILASLLSGYHAYQLSIKDDLTL